MTGSRSCRTGSAAASWLSSAGSLKVVVAVDSFLTTPLAPSQRESLRLVMVVELLHRLLHKCSLFRKIAPSGPHVWANQPLVSLPRCLSFECDSTVR